MIEVQQLVKAYKGIKVVDEVSFLLDQGHTLALLGTSGSGKTTTLKMLNRLIEPTSGTILLNGKDVQNYAKTELRRQMGYVIQSIGLFPHYTIEENIGIVPRLLNWDTGKIRRRAYDLMERLHLSPDRYAGKFPHELSGGQRQRAGIARALAADPPIILMDEPFGALDPITRESIRSEFMDLEELRTKTTVLVTHDVEEAFTMADRICLLDAGKVQQFGTPKELLFAPANDFVRQFLADKIMSLQLQTLQVSDVFEFLPEEASSEAPVLQVSAPSSLQEVMDRLIRGEQGSEQAATTFRGETRVYSLQHLLSAFRKCLN